MKNYNTKEFNNFYLNKAKILDWKKSPTKIIKKNKDNKFEWFPGAKINIYKNCITNNLAINPNKTAIITIENNEFKFFTYNEINELVLKACFFIKKKNKKPKIMIHSSASIYSAVLMLACSRLGCHFSVIFEELEKESIIKRVNLFKPNLFFSRLEKNKFLKKNLSFTKTKFFFKEDLDKIFKSKNKSTKKMRYFKSHNSLFTLFTSGSTGVPKGIIHSSGGYLLHAKMTCIEKFGVNKNSIILTASDAGWINGHTYALFGPLSLNSTTILIDKPISLLNIKLLEKILKLKTNILYLPVTLIRLLKSLYKKPALNCKNITALGSMGEPLAPDVGKWFSKYFSNKNLSIVNTYFQTETGGIICSPSFKDKNKNVPIGSVGSPLNKFVKINNLNQRKKEILLTCPWPGMMKNVLNSKKEWSKYWNKNNDFKLFDLGTKKNNNIFIHGRTDDVINIRGHRIGSEEIESILLKNNEIIECCAISIVNQLQGAKIVLFIVSDKKLNEYIESTLISNFGTFALPEKIIYVKELPKTRSGKILRRLLKNLFDPSIENLANDKSTILNPKALESIEKVIKTNV